MEERKIILKQIKLETYKTIYLKGKQDMEWSLNMIKKEVGVKLGEEWLKRTLKEKRE